MKRLKWALLATFAVAQIADLWTTNAFLARGGEEGNPAMAWLQHALGSGWAVPKLAIPVVILWVFAKAHTRRQMGIVTAAVVLAALAPIWNLTTHALGLAA